MLDEVVLEVELLPPELPLTVVIVEVLALSLSEAPAVTETVPGSVCEPADVAESDVATVGSGVVAATVLPSVDDAVCAAAKASSTNAHINERKRDCMLAKRACE